MFNNYIKVAVRNLFKYKGFSFINIFGLAAGMACCTLIFVWVQNEISYDDFHNNSEDIYKVMLVENTGGVLEIADDKVSFPLADGLLKDFPEVDNTARYFSARMPLKYKDKLLYDNLAGVDPSFLDIFKFDFLKGDASSALEDKNSIVLSQRSAFKYFGNEDPMGKTIISNNETPLTVTGVFKNYRQNSDLRTKVDFLVPLELINKVPFKDEWGAFYLRTYVRLIPNTVHDTFNAKITNYLAEKSPDNAKYQFTLKPFQNMHLFDLNGNWTGMTSVVMFSSLALIILLIACMNYMNLMTARSSIRSKEVGMRKVLGAYKKNIMQQFFGESFVVSGAAFLFSVVLVYLVTPYFNTLTNVVVDFNFSVIMSLLPMYIGLIVLTGLTAGSYPALYLSSFQPYEILKGSMLKQSGKFVLRRIFVLFQFSVSTIFIISIFVIFHQFDYLQKKDLGFEKKNVITILNNKRSETKFADFKNELLKNANITSVTAGSAIPGMWTSTATDGLNWEGKDPEDKTTFHAIYIDKDYVETMRLKIITGSGFTENKSLKNTVIINETAAKHMNFDDPIGKTYSREDETYNIVGVYKDTHLFNLAFGIQPLILMYRPERAFFTFLKYDIGQSSPSNILERIEEIWSTHYADVPFEYSFLEDRLNAMYRSEDSMRKLSGYFALLAIIISSLGILGLMSFVVQQRTKEISIRKVLGASPVSLIKILTFETTMFAVISNLIAWPVTWYLAENWLQDYAFRINLDWSIFAVAGLISIAVAYIPISYHSIKIVKLNPVYYLRNE